MTPTTATIQQEYNDVRYVRLEIGCNVRRAPFGYQRTPIEMIVTCRQAGGRCRTPRTGTGTNPSSMVKVSYLVFRNRCHDHTYANETATSQEYSKKTPDRSGRQSVSYVYNVCCLRYVLFQVHSSQPRSMWAILWGKCWRVISLCRSTPVVWCGETHLASKGGHRYATYTHPTTVKRTSKVSAAVSSCLAAHRLSTLHSKSAIFATYTRRDGPKCSCL